MNIDKQIQKLTARYEAEGKTHNQALALACVEAGKLADELRASMTGGHSEPTEPAAAFDGELIRLRAKYQRDGLSFTVAHAKAVSKIEKRLTAERDELLAAMRAEAAAAEAVALRASQHRPAARGRGLYIGDLGTRRDDGQVFRGVNR